MQEDTANMNDKPQIPPPGGTPEQAEKYVSQIIDLIEQDKLQVVHTDLAKFDPSNLQDHYRLELKDYNVEISHSKNPDNGKDSYIILFTNLQSIRDGCTEKIILAYMHLDPLQFKRFVTSAHEQNTRNKKIEEDKRLQEALQPIDQVLDQLKN